MSKVQFINHSSLIVTDTKTRILCDPWYKGTAFQDGWSLLHDKSHDINDLDFNFIWISHEHPDHFSIETILSLDKPTKFIYQKTSDKKVKKFLEAKGHEVMELEDSKTVKLNEIELTLFICDGYDSSLLFKFSDGKTFLNVNDARLDLDDELSKIKPFCGDSIDMVAIQFSYANWAGNMNDNVIPAHQQELVNEKNIEICKALNPKAVLLFAAFIYYCHEENFYWNNNFWMKTSLQAVSKKGFNAILPKIDQEIDLEHLINGFERSNEESLQFWRNKHNFIKPIIFTSSIPDEKELAKQYNSFYEEIWNNNEKKMCETPENKDFYLSLFLTDLNIRIRIGLFTRLFEVMSNDHICDCEISSETFSFLLKNKFSRGTISINGRINFNYKTAHKFFIFFFIHYANNIGKSFKENILKRVDLSNLRKTSILMSIFQFNPDSKENFKSDLSLFRK